MALSMDEQRILAEIERRLAAEDPGLAARMSSFRRPSPVNVFRSARARVIGSLLTVVVVAMVSLMVYAMLPFRSNASRTLGGHPAASRGQAVMTVSGAGAGGAKAGSAKTQASKAKSSGPAKAAGATSGHSPAARTTAKAARTTGSPSAADGANPASTALKSP